MAAGLAATVVAVPIAQAAPSGNGNGNGTPPDHAGPPADTGPPATPPGQADTPAPASPPSSAGGNPNPGTPPGHSNAGGTAGGNPNPGTPPDHSNAGGNGGGNPTPGTPPAHSNAGGNGGGNPTPGTPPDHSNAAGNGNGGGDDGNGPPGHSNAGGQDKVTICHATGSATNPYVTITVAEPALTAHAAHGDLIPAPAGGCPGDESGPGAGGENNVPAPGNGQEKVGICHATGSATNPYVVIVVAAPAVPAHIAHGDITPIPADGCPGTTTAGEEGTTPVGDSGTPAAPDGGQEKVEICHQTGSDSNPYVVISVAASALPAHLAHGDITPIPAGGCPGENTLAVGSGGEELVRLCHATGDDSDPYEILTVPASEVPGHIDHGDVIGEECPGSGVLAATGTGSGSGDPDEEAEDAVLAAAGTGDPGVSGFDDTGAAGDETSGTLPFTGLDLLAMAIVGGILLLTGWQLRRMRGGAASG